MTTLNSRVGALESVRTALRAVHVKGLQCDDGPYDAEALAEGWVDEGVFESSSARYEGKDAIRTFYRGLSAQFTMHYYTNVVVTRGPAAETAHIHLYGFETPVINARSAVGFFGHEVDCRIAQVDCLWTSWRQTIHAIAPFSDGWERGERIMKQTK